MVAILSAFSTFGRFTVTQAIAFFFSNRIFSKVPGVADEDMSVSFSVLIRVYPRPSAADELSDLCGRLFRGKAPQSRVLRHRLLRILVVVETLARLAPVPARQHHALEQGR